MALIMLLNSEMKNAALTFGTKSMQRVVVVDTNMRVETRTNVNVYRSAGMTFAKATTIMLVITTL